MPPRSNLRDQIAEKRKETQKLAPATSASSRSGASARNTTNSSVDIVEDKSVNGQIRKASKSGKLDLASLALQRIPPNVYISLLGVSPRDLSRPPDISERTDPPGGYGDSEEIVSWKVGDNEIDELEKEIGGFGGLKVFEMPQNQLHSLPTSFADLLRLTTVDLSFNQLITIPPTLLLLPKLQSLDLSHNLITAIDLSSPIAPSPEAHDYGAGFLTTAFSRPRPKGQPPIWPELRVLNLGYNKIRNAGLKGLRAVKSFAGLRVINLEYNLLDGELDLGEIGLERDIAPSLNELIFSGNKALQTTTGEIAPNAKITMVGCNISGASIINEDVPDQSKPKTTKTPRETNLPTPNPTATFVYRTLPAATFDSLPLSIAFDIYLPPTPAGPLGHPLVIWFHGGGLLQGNKENLPPHFRRLPTHAYSPTNESIAVISPNYRLAPQVPILDILGDITSLLEFVQVRLNEKLVKGGWEGHGIDTGRICLSGGSAGGYLALIAGLGVPSQTSEEDVGGYRGELGANKGIKCLAPFYPITDLTDVFWATKTDPVLWFGRHVTHEEARPHLDLKAEPIATSVSGGPRSILYPYMLQHALFPSLLFMRQKAISSGRETFRPEPLQLSIPYRLDLFAKSRSGAENARLPVYLIYGTADTAVQRFEKTVEALRGTKGDLMVEEREGEDHAFDEDPAEECLKFRDWLGKTLL